MSLESEFQAFLALTRTGHTLSKSLPAVSGQMLAARHLAVGCLNSIPSERCA